MSKASPFHSNNPILQSNTHLNKWVEYWNIMEIFAANCLQGLPVLCVMCYNHLSAFQLSPGQKASAYMYQSVIAPYLVTP